VVVLNETNRADSSFQMILPENLRKEAAIIPMSPGGDEKKPLDVQRADVQAQAPR
jgi:hypothetical protein